jgi:hypothetical protein
MDPASPHHFARARLLRKDLPVSLDDLLNSMTNSDGASSGGQLPDPSQPLPGSMPSGGVDTQAGGGDLLSALLGGMMSGAGAPQEAAPQGGMPQSGGGDLLSALLGGMMSGAGAPQGAMPQGGGGDLLSALLGGMAEPQGGMPQSGGGDPLSALLGGMSGSGMGAPEGGIPSAGMPQGSGGSGLSGLAAIVAPVLGSLLVNGLQNATAGAGGRQVDMATAQQAVMDQAERIVPRQVVQNVSQQLDVPPDHVYVGGMYLVSKLNRAAQAHNIPPQQLMAGLRSGEIRMDTTPLAVEFSRESGMDPREAHALMRALSMSMGIKPAR